jgi:hypothetical protein
MTCRYVDFTYQPTPSSASSVTLLTGSGRRSYTNRFGSSFTTRFTLVPPTAANDNVVILSTVYPLTAKGLLLNLSTPVEMPGASPTTLEAYIPVYASSQGFVVEGGGTGVDGAGSAYLSPLTGFTNVSIPTSNINHLAVDYDNCQAPITFVNGRVIPTQPSLYNGAKNLLWSASISDGTTYSVSLQLNVTTVSAFATTQDMLGNPYQILTNITGSRVYTYLPTGQTVTSVVTSSVPMTGRFYPYTFLSVSPGVYTTDTVPHLDGDGWQLQLKPSVPLNGLAPGSGTQYSSQVVKVLMGIHTAAILETNSQSVPLIQNQTQTYTMLRTVSE